MIAVKGKHFSGTRKWDLIIFFVKKLFNGHNIALRHTYNTVFIKKVRVELEWSNVWH